MRSRTNQLHTPNSHDFYSVIFFVILSLFITFIFWLVQKDSISSSLEEILLLVAGIATALAIRSFQEILLDNSSTEYRQENSNPLSAFDNNQRYETTNLRATKSSIESKLPRTLIEAHEVQSDGVLATSSTVIGVISLELFARKHKPRCIVGVNRGGWLLSTYLAHRLNIDRDSLFRFNATTGDILDNNIDIFSDINKNIDLDILLVDDISRTGDSISKAIDCIKKRFPLCKISVAVLVVCGRKTDETINYNPYWTQHKDIQLPWSSDERKKEARRIIDAQGKVVVLGDPNSLEQKGPILRIADHETKDGEEFDISSDDIKVVISMMEKFFFDSETTIEKEVPHISTTSPLKG